MSDTHVTTSSTNNISSVSLAIQGMHCTNCANTIERKYRKLDGIKDVHVNIINNKANISFDPNIINVNQILEVFNNLAFTAEIIPNNVLIEDKQRIERENKNKKHNLHTFVLSLVLTIIILFIGMYPGMHMLVGDFIASWFTTSHHISHGVSMFCANIVLLLLTIPVQFYCGARFYKGAYYALKNKSANMDVLVALGTTIAFLFSLWITFVTVITGDWSGMAALEINEGMPYFETCAMLITFVLLGKMLEARAKNATNQAIEALINLVPDKAIVIRGGVEQEIPVSEVIVGDIIIVKPGQRIPVDGKIVDGKTEIDESMLTGESLPIFKHKDDQVIAGTYNTTGTITVLAQKIGADSTLAQIINIVENAQSTKADIQNFADKISSVFVPIIIGISIITFLCWIFFVPAESSWIAFQSALLPAIAVIVVACPCALGLATPTALVVAMGKAAQYGILIKDGAVLEHIKNIKAIVFDKTGTITKGQPQVIKTNIDDTQLLKEISALESKSEHPIASAIIEYVKKKTQYHDTAEETEENQIQVDNFKTIIGEGVKGLVSGKEIFIGTNKNQEEAQASVFVNDSYKGSFIIEDEIKENAKQTIDELKNKYYIQPYLITGDNESSAQKIAKQADIDISNIYYKVKPTEKADYVEKIKTQIDEDTDNKNKAFIAFVGDGINDAPALAISDIGIAMASGTDIAIDTGDIVLMKNDLSDIIVLMRLSYATIRKIKQNLFWALIYNCIMIPLAAIGIIAPALAGAAMALSSISVACNSLLLKRFKK